MKKFENVVQNNPGLLMVKIKGQDQNLNELYSKVLLKLISKYKWKKNMQKKKSINNTNINNCWHNRYLND
jgi:hypothetical protein